MRVGRRRGRNGRRVCDRRDRLRHESPKFEHCSLFTVPLLALPELRPTHSAANRELQVPSVTALGICRRVPRPACNMPHPDSWGAAGRGTPFPPRFTAEAVPPTAFSIFQPARWHCRCPAHLYSADSSRDRRLERRQRRWSRTSVNREPRQVASTGPNERRSCGSVCHCSG